jgi:hypothetical protein
MFQAGNVVLKGVNDSEKLGSTSSSNDNCATVHTTDHVMVKRNGVKGIDDEDESDDVRCWLGGLASNEACLDIMQILER